MIFDFRNPELPGRVPFLRGSAYSVKIWIIGQLIIDCAAMGVLSARWGETIYRVYLEDLR